MARAVLSSLPRAISTPGLTLATAQVQERLQKGLPYFFPRKTATQAFAEATRIVRSAVQQWIVPTFLPTNAVRSWLP